MTNLPGPEQPQKLRNIFGGEKVKALISAVVWPETEALDSVAVLLRSVSFSFCSNEARRAGGQHNLPLGLCLGGNSIFQGLNKSPAASRISSGPGPH